MRLLLFATLLCSSASFAQSAEQEAGDVSEVERDRTGPLKDRIRPVSGHFFLKRGRFEVSPSLTVSVNDAFFTKYIVGGSATFHILESVALSVRGGTAFNRIAGAGQICISPEEAAATGRTAGCGPPTYEQLDGRAPGQITLLAGADVQWAPLYGKISLVAESFLPFDLYGIAGLAYVGYRGPPAGAPESLSSLGANLGVGMRMFFTRWITLRAELRDVLYTEKIGAFGDNSSALRQQLLFELGLSFFIPTNFNES